MSWLTLLVLLQSATESRPAKAHASEVLGMTISAKTDKGGRWCSNPIFEARVSNRGSKPVWLDLGAPGDDIDVSSYHVSYGVDGARGSDGGVVGGTHDWGSIETLRGPAATLLKPRESASRTVKLDDVRLSAGRVKVELSIRIYGTDDLNASNVQTYRPEATTTLILLGRGKCFEVRRLTRR